ncbi:hypothetical protein GGR56DRAFT_658235 [Xylariaceae sp. FL0804]|nr:hypothetical protein GGR56DRAFT_658235 [Xylariaceae sp. FL0804]
MLASARPRLMFMTASDHTDLALEGKGCEAPLHMQASASLDGLRARQLALLWVLDRDRVIRASELALRLLVMLLVLIIGVLVGRVTVSLSAFSLVSRFLQALQRRPCTCSRPARRQGPRHQFGACRACGPFASAGVIAKADSSLARRLHLLLVLVILMTRAGHALTGWDL